MTTHETHLNDLLACLRRHGYAVTAARRRICAGLAAAGGHLSADQLHERLVADTPSLGRMTVYRTLDLLGELGAIRPIYHGSGAAHYVLLHDGHHHHLVCGRCDKVIEMDECVLGEMVQAIGDRFDFEIEGHLLEFFGVCAECRA